MSENANTGPSSDGRPPCPKCKSARVVPVVFGMPAPELSAQAQRGEVALGGCMCWGDERDNKWACRDCRHEFGGVEGDTQNE